MNKLINGVLGLIGVGILSAIILVGMYFYYSNSEVRLRNSIVAKQKDNQSEMDAMWKNISQTAQVAEKDRQSLMDIFNGYAGARTGGKSAEDSNRSLMNWIKESVPTVSSDTMKQLMNIIVAQRDGFKFRQKELLDLKREHDNVIDTYPSHLFVGGRGKIDVVIVTSTRTDEAFRTGKDDDVKLFSK